MKKLILSLILLPFAFSSYAQVGVVFDFMEYDFGQINQSEGKVKTDFTFTNNTNIPLFIRNVRPTCGCTSSDFTHDTIFPGKKGFVNATFDPLKGMLGKFSKMVEVNTNIGSYKLTITGNVYNPNVKETPNQYLSFSKTYTDLGEQFFGSVHRDTIVVKNITPYQQEIKTVTNSTQNIKVTFSRKILAPNTQADIYVEFVLNDPRMFGESQTGFTLLTSDFATPMMSFNYHHIIQEKFPKLTKKYLRKAPRLKIDKTEIDFGFVKPGTIHKTQFTLTNTGKDTLFIRKSKSACSCLSFELPKHEIAPGETVILSSSFDTVQRKKGENTKYITLITNDPLASTIALKHFYILIN